MSAPLVSVMMPAYNAGKYIKQAIQSMQDQIYENWQLCIVDDGSTDDTYNIAFKESLKDCRICFTQVSHVGCPTARNMCLDMCEGDIIARLDADDFHDRRRLHEQVKFLLENDDYDLVTCKMYWWKDDKAIITPVGAMNPEAYVKGQRGSGICNASIVAWKYVYDKVEFNNSLLAGSDGDWNLQVIEAEFKWGFIPRPMYYQRRHSGQITQRLGRQQRENHERSRKRLYKTLFRKS